MKDFREVEVPINLDDVTKEDMKVYIENKYTPEDMFDDDVLAEWAMEQGFIHKDDVR